MLAAAAGAHGGAGAGGIRLQARRPHVAVDDDGLLEAQDRDVGVRVRGSLGHGRQLGSGRVVRDGRAEHARQHPARGDGPVAEAVRRRQDAVRGDEGPDAGVLNAPALPVADQHHVRELLEQGQRRPPLRTEASAVRGCEQVARLGALLDALAARPGQDGPRRPACGRRQPGRRVRRQALVLLALLSCHFPGVGCRAWPGRPRRRRLRRCRSVASAAAEQVRHVRRVRRVRGRRRGRRRRLRLAVRRALGLRLRRAAHDGPLARVPAQLGVRPPPELRDGGGADRDTPADAAHAGRRVAGLALVQVRGLRRLLAVLPRGERRRHQQQRR